MMPELFPIDRHFSKVSMRWEFVRGPEFPRLFTVLSVGNDHEQARFGILFRKKCRKDLENVLIWE
jgi:hypothetical protein